MSIVIDLLAGMVFEGILVGLYFLFPVGPCAGSMIGGTVLVVHSPAVIIVDKLLPNSSAMGNFVVPALMVPLWAVLFHSLRRPISKP